MLRIKKFLISVTVFGSGASSGHAPDFPDLMQPFNWNVKALTCIKLFLRG